MVIVRLPLEVPNESSTPGWQEFSEQREFSFDRLFAQDGFPCPHGLKIGREKKERVRDIGMDMGMPCQV